jgi:hypothetical protein
MLQKNRTKHNAFFLIILFVPLLLLAIAMQHETTIFTLSFSPLNVQTTASIDDETMVFDTTGQSLTVQQLSPNIALRIRFYVSGFFLVNQPHIDNVPILTDGRFSPYGSIDEMNEIGWYNLSSRVNEQGEWSLIMGNFAIISNEEFAYGFYVSELILYKRGL